MTPTRIYTLFSVPQLEHRSPSAVVVSVVMHGVGFVWLALGASHAPRILVQSPPERYSVRVLSAPLEDPPMRQSAQLATPGMSKGSAQHGSPPGGHLTALPFLAPPIADLPPAPQTLIQPDAPPQIAITKPVPIPQVVVWSAEISHNPTIVPPPPPKISVVAAKASIVPPNREQAPADIRLSSTRFTAEKLALAPSTTSPVVVRAPEPPQQVPQTASKSVAEPTPARVVSLSDTQTKDKAVVPFANSVARKASSDSLAPGQSQTSSEAGSGNPASKQNEASAGPSGAKLAEKTTAGGSTVAQNGTAPSGNAAVTQSGTAQGGSPGAIPGFGLGEPPLVHIHLPKDGQYGVVVVGSSLADKYPETVDLWSGRLLYTVYLHVGLSKNWILQYSVPRSAGNASQPAAPWPYDIVRPSVAPDPNADAILVHGFVDVAGHFEQLAVAFPPGFGEAAFLLHALQQWQFRPATQNGQPISVEVVLIIPSGTE